MRASPPWVMPLSCAAGQIAGSSVTHASNCSKISFARWKGAWSANEAGAARCAYAARIPGSILSEPERATCERRLRIARVRTEWTRIGVERQHSRDVPFEKEVSGHEGNCDRYVELACLKHTTGC